MEPNPIMAWLTAEGRSAVWLADKIGITPGYLSRIGSRKAQPSKTIAVALESVTGIPASVWVKA